MWGRAIAWLARSVGSRLSLDAGLHVVNDGNLRMMRGLKDADSNVPHKEYRTWHMLLLAAHLDHIERIHYCRCYKSSPSCRDCSALKCELRFVLGGHESWWVGLCLVYN